VDRVEWLSVVMEAKTKPKGYDTVHGVVWLVGTKGAVMHSL
jgi:hypothetical protein